MSDHQSNKDSYLRWLPVLFILLGIFIRIIVFIYNRSFFLDEANLALNIVEKNYSAFFGSLSYDQYAPPLFMVSSKFMVTTIGIKDQVLRIVPLLSSIGSIILLWLILKEWVKDYIIIAYGLGLFCFSVLAIRYGTEFKQYSSDTFIALLLVYYGWRAHLYKMTKLRYVAWLVGGSLCLWYSMPAVLVLAGVAALMVLSNKNSPYALLFLFFAWSQSFLAYYFSVLKKSIANEALADYHDDYFFNLIPRSGSDIIENFHLLESLLRTVFDKSGVSIVFGLLILGYGIYLVARSSRPIFMLVVLPIILTIGLSGLQLYSMIPRMTLFIVPLMIVLATIGLDGIWWALSPLMKLLIGLLMIFGIYNNKGHIYVTQKMEFDNIKLVLNEISTTRMDSTPVYVHYLAVPACKYYTNHESSSYSQTNFHWGKWDDASNWNDSDAASKDFRYAIIYRNNPSHTPQIVSRLSESKVRVSHVLGKRAALYSLE